MATVVLIVEGDPMCAKISLLYAVNSFQSALSGRRKLEVDLQTLLQEHEELQAELRGSTDKAKKASCELARVGEELRLEQEHSLHLERVKKGLEAQVKEMSSRLDEAEQTVLKGGKKIIQKLEGKVKELEMELDSEQKRHAETGYSTPHPRLVRSPSSVGSEGQGEKILNDDNESVSSLIPAYLDSLKKLMID
ncbi:hypothetical protein fugu_001217 [Takifugu bimaculatus]|uniref:Myosin tail domain-containing protein n=1 Tax=Takifugu bimaculatus TaxID=433685 RepID=A0A4Z2CJ09_9TELE|nr:hypothetical protein fugu_001217 [Takifugu bimaculatus]